MGKTSRIYEQNKYFVQLNHICTKNFQDKCLHISMLGVYYNQFMVTRHPDIRMKREATINFGGKEMPNHRVFILNGDCIETKRFCTAESAHKEYICAIENLKTRLPKGSRVTVSRYSGCRMIEMETVYGAL